MKTRFMKFSFALTSIIAISLFGSCVPSRSKIETKSALKKPLLPPSGGSTPSGTSTSGGGTGYVTAGTSNGYVTGGTVTSGTTTSGTTTSGTTTGGSGTNTTGGTSTGGSSGGSGGSSGGNSGGSGSGGKTNGGSGGKTTGDQPSRTPAPVPDSNGAYTTTEISSKEDLKNLGGSAYGEHGGVWGPTKGSPDQRQLQVGDSMFLTERLDSKGKPTGDLQYWKFEPTANGGKWTPINDPKKNGLPGPAQSDGGLYPTIIDPSTGHERVVSPKDPGLPFMIQEGLKAGTMSENESRSKFGNTMVDQQMEQIRMENPAAWEKIKSNTATGTDPQYPNNPSGAQGGSQGAYTPGGPHPDDNLFDDVPSGDFSGGEDYDY